MGAFETEEVLPAHEYRFADLGARIAEIEDHHAERLEEIVSVLDRQGASTAWEITVQLPWSRPWEEIQPFMQRQANGETLAHCVVLELAGRVERVAGPPSRFQITSPAPDSGG